MHNKLLWVNGTTIYRPRFVNTHGKSVKSVGYYSKPDTDFRKLQRLQLVKKKHQLVRDLFIFQCYTGLTYSEMINLTIHDIRIDKRNVKGMIKRPVTTLLQKPIFIINRYKPLMGESEILFPQYSIQRYIQYLGEIWKQ